MYVYIDHGLIPRYSVLSCHSQMIHLLVAKHVFWHPATQPEVVTQHSTYQLARGEKKVMEKQKGGGGLYYVHVTSSLARTWFAGNVAMDMRLIYAHLYMVHGH